MLFGESGDGSMRAMPLGLSPPPLFALVLYETIDDVEARGREGERVRAALFFFSFFLKGSFLGEVMLSFSALHGLRR